MVRATRGFTLVEILVVLAIALVVATLTIAAFSNIRAHFAHRAAVQDIHSALIDARIATLSARNDTVHGVRLDAGRVVRFEGPTYSAGAPTNRAVSFSYGVTAATTTGLTSSIVFTRLTGAAVTSGTITVTEPRSGRTATIVVYSSGLIEL